MTLTTDEVIDTLRKILDTRGLGQRSTCSASMMILKFADALGREPESFTREIMKGVQR